MNLEDERDQELRELEEKIELAKKEEGDLELRDLYVRRAEYFMRRGAWRKGVAGFEEAIAKTAGTQKKLEFYLEIVQAYFKQGEARKFAECLETCKRLNEEGGDWEKKNKLLVYEGMWLLMKRDLGGAARVFLSCVNTFNAPEILDFRRLVFYGVALGMVSLPRQDVKKRILDNSEVVAVLREDPLLEGFLDALYHRKYRAYFPALVRLAEQRIDADPFLAAHRNYYVRLARLVVYSQYLESYKTVRLDKMAADFGFSVAFLDRELFHFIASRKLSCQVDKVRGLVESSHLDSRVARFKDLLRNGDNLVEKMHKVARTALF